ncbi:MAG: hypothetical protein MJ239_07690, partial [Bacilli bacterium]|nr:hypothetical protein [Bacilli bacterium]
MSDEETKLEETGNETAKSEPIQKKKMPKGARIAVIISASLVGFIGVAYLGMVTYFRAPVSNYYNHSERAFVIPGIDDGLIGQGLDYDEDSENFVMCGYRSKGASQIGIVEKGSGKTIKMLNLLNEDGSNNTAHAGGLTVHGEYLYICHSSSGSKNALDVYSWAEALSTKEDSIKCIGKVNLAFSDQDYLKPSWTTDYDGKIVIGEFYNKGDHETNPLHQKGENKAIAVEFNFDDTKTETFGIDLTPVKAYSLPSKVQGAAFDNDYMYLSTSYGPAFSHIEFCNVNGVNSEGKVTVFGQEVDYVTATPEKSLLAPPMSEEIELISGWMVTMCEAASNKYVFGKFTGARYCYST